MTVVLLPLGAIAGLLLAGRYGAGLVLTGAGRIPLTVRPEDFGLPSEKAEFKAKDGVTLRGWYIPAPRPGGRTIIFCHGWGANKGELLRFTYPLRERGFNLIYFDFRFCGESDGELLSVGFLEAMDFDAAIDYARSKRPGDRLGVYGLSMGAMVALAGMTRHADIKAAVLESPFASHNQAVARYAWAKRGIPYYPLLPLAFFWIRRRLGADPESSSPERLAPLLNGAPILMIHGERDALCPPEIGSGLLEKIKGPKQQWVVPGAGHACCAETAGGAYQEKLADFYERNL